MHSMDSQLRRLFVIAVCIKIVLLGIALVGWQSGLFCDVCYSLDTYPVYTQAQWWMSLLNWDARSYISLAEHWYLPKNAPINAFYPLYPLMVKLAQPLFFGNPGLAAIAISTLCSFAALGVFYHFVKTQWNAKTAYIASLILLTFPTNFYLHLAYTESLFLLFAIVSIMASLEGQGIPLLFSGIALPLLRPQGFFMVIPSVFTLLTKKLSQQWGVLLVSCIAFGSGMMLYFVAVYLATGSPFAGIAAQEFYLSHNNLLQIIHPIQWLWATFAATTLEHLPGTSSIDRICFVLFLLSLIGIYRTLPRYLFVYAISIGLLPALLGNLMSFPRYLAAIFPIYIFLALRYQKRYLWIVVPFGILQCILFFMHAMNYWVA